MAGRFYKERNVMPETVKPIKVGIYDAKTNKLLERCEERILESARAHWLKLGYVTTVGPAFKNLIPLSSL